VHTTPGRAGAFALRVFTGGEMAERRDPRHHRGDLQGLAPRKEGFMLPQIVCLILHLEMGWQPLDTWRGYTPSVHVDKGADVPLYATLGAEVEILGMVFVGFDVRTELTVKELKAGGFSPHLMNYGFTVGLRPVEGVELGFRHHCVHPMVPYMDTLHFTLTYEGVYQEVYLRIDKKIPLF